MIRVLLVIHLLLCIIMVIVKHKNKVKIETPLFLVVLLVPVFGFLLYLIDCWIEAKHKDGTRDIGIDKLKVDDIKYRKLEVERESNRANVVPLEEAIAVNDEKTRRRLMLDILQQNPEEHLDLLQKTRMADDTELTHYATTTMLEIQSAYEETIRKLENEIAVLYENQNQSQRKTKLKKLYRELEKYMKSGLISGNILLIYRRKMTKVLETLIEEEPDNQAYYLAWIENEIEDGRLDQVEKRLQIAKERWANSEDVYCLYVRYYATTHQGEMIQKTLNEIEKKEIYLSNKGKQWFSFWKNKEC